MQLEQTFLEAVSYIQAELLKLGLSSDVVQSINDVTGEYGSEKSVDSLKKQFPGATDACAKFDLDSLQEVLQKAVSGSSQVVTIPELAVFSHQVALLHELRRLVARRKSSRISRVVLAAHRRSTVGGKNGKVSKALLVKHEQTLATLRG